MRLQSHIWVSAYLRAVEQAGASVLLVRRGEASAGAIYIKISHLDGTGQLFCPALLLDDSARDERAWASEFGNEPIEEHEIDSFLKTQTSYDADLWIIEVEDRQGRHFLEDQVQTL